jgi:hypothetical protein
MWWNSVPSWMQGMGMGSGMGQPMTPGAGMPPYSRAPMSMAPVQMGPPSPIPGAPPPPAQPQPPLNPAQMGLLSGMLAQQTRGPGAAVPPWSQISPQAMEGVIPGMGGAEAKTYMQGLAPDQVGLLARLLPGLFGGR